MVPAGTLRLTMRLPSTKMLGYFRTAVSVAVPKPKALFPPCRESTRFLFTFSRLWDNSSPVKLALPNWPRVLEQLGGIDLKLATLISSHAIGLRCIQKYALLNVREELLPKLANRREISDLL